MTSQNTLGTEWITLNDHWQVQIELQQSSARSNRFARLTFNQFDENTDYLNNIVIWIDSDAAVMRLMNVALNLNNHDQKVVYPNSDDQARLVFMRHDDLVFISIWADPFAGSYDGAHYGGWRHQNEIKCSYECLQKDLAKQLALLMWARTDE